MTTTTTTTFTMDTFTSSLINKITAAMTNGHPGHMRRRLAPIVKQAQQVLKDRGYSEMAAFNIVKDCKEMAELAINADNDTAAYIAPVAEVQQATTPPLITVETAPPATQYLLDFIALAVEIALTTRLSLIAALHEAATLYPELAAVTPDMPAVDVLPFETQYSF